MKYSMLTKTSRSSAKALVSEYNLTLDHEMKWQNNKGLMCSKVKFYSKTSAFAVDLGVFVNIE
jgi:hypothetical protein